MLHTITPPIDVPRAQLDPITTLAEKLSVFALAISRPLRNETVVLCTDHQQRGVGIFIFDSKLKLTQIIDRIIGAAINVDATTSISILSSRGGVRSAKCRFSTVFYGKKSMPRCGACFN